MRLKHRCKKCKRDMSIDLNYFPKVFRFSFFYIVWKGDADLCAECMDSK